MYTQWNDVYHDNENEDVCTCENVTFKKGPSPQISNMAALYENVQ